MITAENIKLGQEYYLRIENTLVKVRSRKIINNQLVYTLVNSYTDTYYVANIQQLYCEVGELDDEK